LVVDHDDGAGLQVVGDGGEICFDESGDLGGAASFLSA
jgi:hypothetical protein